MENIPGWVYIVGYAVYQIYRLIQNSKAKKAAEEVIETLPKRTKAVIQKTKEQDLVLIPERDFSSRTLPQKDYPTELNNREIYQKEIPKKEITKKEKPKKEILPSQNKALSLEEMYMNEKKVGILEQEGYEMNLADRISFKEFQITQKTKHPLIAEVKSPNDLKKYFLWNEILSKPKGLQ